MDLAPLILKAQSGDLAAFGRIVEATQHMVHAVCFRMLRQSSDALDAAQETYLRAFNRVGELRDSAAFPGWLRRIAVTACQDFRRKRRVTFLSPEELPEVPVLDEFENTWTELQRLALAAALVTLSPEDRRLCDRFYHGNWSTQRLADDAGITEPALRKRLERIRTKLRKEIEMSEQLNSPSTPATLPARIVELLAKPTLVDLPENPVGAFTDLLRRQFPGYTDAPLEEILNLTEARRLLGHDPVYVPPESLHRLDANRILRFDMTVPLLLAARNKGAPVRLTTAGKVYRNDSPSSTRLQAFHQMEYLAMDTRQNLDPWAFIGSVLRALHALLPDLPQRLCQTTYPICTQAWEIGLEKDGRVIEIAGGGVYNPDVVRFLGGDPDRHIACGHAFGLERLAAIRYNIDDIRKVEAARL